jgi:hypothetical protein
MATRPHPRQRPMLLVAGVAVLLGACGGGDAGSPDTADAVTEPVDAAVEGQLGSAVEEQADAVTEAVGPDATASGTVTAGAGTYDFTATACFVSPDDIEINGPATAPDGGPAYVDFSAQEGAGELHVVIGTDDQFASSDDIEDQLFVGRFNDLEFTLDGSQVRADVAFTDADGAAAGAGTFEVDCG